MRPSFPVNDHPNICRANIKLAAYGPHRLASDCIYGPNVSHLAFGQIASFLSACYAPEFKPPFRLRDCIFGGPTAHDSVSQNVVTHTVSFGHSEHAQCLPLKRQKVCAPSISGLFVWRGPSAVRSLVVSVVVDAVKRMSSGWFVSHVHHEAFKSTHSKNALHPSATDPNSSGAVISEFGILWISASTQHRRPLSVCRMLVRFWIVVFRKLQNVFAGLAHVIDGLSSSAGLLASTGDRRAYFCTSFSQGTQRAKV